MCDFPQIVGVGHNCLDQLCTVEAYPPEDGSTHITSISVQGGGAVATAMAAASRLGVSAAIVGYLGDDATGDEICRLLEMDNVKTSWIHKIEGERSSVSYVMIDRSCGSRTKFPFPDALPSIEWNEERIEVIRHAKVLHLDGTKYDNAMRAAQIAKAAGVPVSLDGCSMQKDNKRNHDLVSMADILIMNAKYPTRVSGKEDYSEALLDMATWGPKIVIGTLGSQGCMAVINKEVVSFPAYRVKAVDTTGAGDVFHGAFLVGWLYGMDLADNIRFASAVSALKCTKVGGRAGIPTFEAAIALMNESHDLNRDEQNTPQREVREEAG